MRVRSRCKALLLESVSARKQRRKEGRKRTNSAAAAGLSLGSTTSITPSASPKNCARILVLNRG